MSLTTAERSEPKYIYKPEPALVHHLKSLHDHVHKTCAPHFHKLVKVETMDGDVFEGHIVHCDKGILYLRLSTEGNERAFFPAPLPYPSPYSSFVLPLVLFNLLAISLL
ncbi:hypothetical protein [Cohnella thailandensis]|jgi:hypothetical protein|uniref:Uncharacterized protein n=1 Tax=Cohnella thailandensis TaxID=557557 RepID=A0A841T0M8_9BACL|nr:hypothetical protein [Cohnella thailandensis]MBB6637714.1 hypothetical protein [Cohnella thailandensis]MBP1974109.1 hypothetical protein [Cohnella thailandensis]